MSRSPSDTPASCYKDGSGGAVRCTLAAASSGSASTTGASARHDWIVPPGTAETACRHADHVLAGPSQGESRRNQSEQAKGLVRPCGYGLGSMGDAAEFPGITPNGGQHAPSAGLYQWLRHHESRFTAALQDLARSLDNAPELIDYRRRRQALQGWCLDPGTWREITSRLPPVPGPVQPTLDDRKRQEASASAWSHITHGELRFAPRPIEAGPPEPVRKAWLYRLGATWFQLSRSDPLAHYTELRKLLIQHAEHLAKEIVRPPAIVGGPHKQVAVPSKRAGRIVDSGPARQVELGGSELVTSGV